MPYLPTGRKKELLVEPQRAKEPGDFNYLFSQAMLKHWLKPEHQRYKTIHQLRKSVVNPAIVDEVDDIDNLLVVLGVPQLDRETARELAFLEFYRRIGSYYEDLAIEKNGDLEEYQKAQDFLLLNYRMRILK